MSKVNSKVCVQCGKIFNTTDGSSLCSINCYHDWEQSTPDLYEDDELDK